MTPDTDKERAEFEAWYASTDDAPAEPDHIYEFDEDGMNELAKGCIWIGWQARAAKAPAAEPVAWRQFMTDVLTAAGLVSHGKQCKALGDRLMKGCTTFRAPPAPTEQWVTEKTTASGAANAGLHALADRIEEAQGRAICISVESADYLREALAASAPVAPTVVDMVPTPELQRMTASRAAFFVERFLREEKLLGPNEQAALQFVLARIAAPLQQGEYPETLYEGGRESVDDALAVVESFGPGVQGLNDTFARQVLLGQEVRRLRAAYEHACKGRSDFRNLYRAARGAAQAAQPEGGAK